MLAIQKPSAEEPAEVVQGVDVPDVDANEVLVRVQAASLCGSDLEALTGEGSPRFEYPLILGHEGAGVIETVDENVDYLAEGDRVAIHYPTTCDHCRHCLAGFDNQCRNRASIGTHRDGTFAEFVAVPARNALQLGPDIPFEWGSIASCAVSTAYHAVSTGEVSPGDSVIVFGTGGVGLHAVYWADFHGASTVIAADINEAKHPMAQNFGADITIDPSSDGFQEVIECETGGWGADVAIECSGASTAFKQAVASVNGANRYESGNIVSVGLQTNPLSAEYWDLREGKLTVSGDHTRAELDRILRLLDSGTVNLSKSVTHRFDLQDIFDAVELLTAGNEAVCRIALFP